MRNYEVQVEVFPCSPEQKAAISEVLRNWGMEIDGETESFDDNYEEDGWCWWGTIQLGGGRTEKQAHDELRALLPGLLLNTRWRYLDEQPWDEEFSSEPLPTAA
jgi:hypothetical protein